MSPTYLIHMPCMADAVMGTLSLPSSKRVQIGTLDTSRLQAGGRVLPQLHTSTGPDQAQLRVPQQKTLTKVQLTPSFTLQVLPERQKLFPILQRRLGGGASTTGAVSYTHLTLPTTPYV